MKKALIVCEKISDRMAGKAVKLAEEAGFETDCVRVGAWPVKKLGETDLLIYVTDGIYEEERTSAIADFVRAGKTLILLGGKPFSKPLAGKTVWEPENNTKGIRALGIGDDFKEAPLEAGPMTLEKCRTVTEEQAGIKADREPLEQVIKAYYGLYTLCKNMPLPEELRRYASLENLARICTEDGRCIACPVTRVRFLSGGSIFFFAYNTENGNLLENRIARQCFHEALQAAGTAPLQFTAEMSFGRYMPGETPEIRISDISAPCLLKITVYMEKNAETVWACETAVKKKAVIPVPVCEEGVYLVGVTGCAEGRETFRQETGFMMLSDNAILKEVGAFPRMTLPEAGYSGFLRQGGKNVNIHGTAYFVTDVFQKCFIHFNAARMLRDLKQLKTDGFNVLRSGNWMMHTVFFGKDGRITEYAVRALQAYFYAAARLGFTVQFTLGNIALDNWYPKKCAIHDPVLKKRQITLVTRFSQEFRNYGNVCMDLINEPSYSQAGGWKCGARPSRDPHEKKAWQKWLRKKYGTIQKLRHAWGENASACPDFGAVDVPEPKCYEGSLYRTEEERCYTKVIDFRSFAEDSYSAWLNDLRRIVRENAPDMMFIMGRDEPYRVPEEQRLFTDGLLDMICFHQWNRDAALYTEYLLNRVKGAVTCAQELGMYRTEQFRGSKKLTDEAVADKLLKKLMYGFGNWVQWQSWSNTDRQELCENMLGIYRGDRSETPAAVQIRKLIAAEDRALPFMNVRDEEAFPFLTLYTDASYHTILEPQFTEGIRNHVYVLNNRMRLQSDFMPDSIFDRMSDEELKKIKALFVPACMRISDSAFLRLTEYLKNGGTVILSGNPDENEMFMAVPRLAALTGRKFRTVPVHDFEKVCIDGKEFLLNFRSSACWGDTENFYYKTVPENSEDENGILEFTVGSGKLYYSPVPPEICGSPEAAQAFYEYALNKTGVSNEVYEADKAKPYFFIHAIRYDGCTLYTAVNEGPDDVMHMKDLRSGKTFEITLGRGKSGKYWIDADGGMPENWTNG